MKYPTIPNDSERVEFVKNLAILDTQPGENLNRVVSLCHTIFEVPIANISIIADDRDWFMTSFGLNAAEERRDYSFSNFAIAGEDIFEVPNALEHPEISQSPLVTETPGIRYYAGAPLKYDQYNLGALCLLDTKPREPLDDRGRQILRELSLMVVREIRIQRILRESLALIAHESIIDSQ
jgi:GAF domain-containing protein